MLRKHELEFLEGTGIFLYTLALHRTKVYVARESFLISKLLKQDFGDPTQGLHPAAGSGVSAGSARHVSLHLAPRVRPLQRSRIGCPAGHTESAWRAIICVQAEGHS